ncbi:UDP-glucose 4-epimerase GalE [Candidatus Eisenbacteria bacterium]|uniref:UDP-glucose 4-epimerase n=1 Tax=Eiseniibacteriota bacterium TaxID=2212470 RepID=A0ABV6YM15_UNCEI
MRVLVSGGAGYIGSVTAEVLLKSGHEVVVLDNLSRGHRAAVPTGATFAEGDVRRQDAVRQLLEDHRIECVMHFSASSLVGESMVDPGEYFGNNVVGVARLLEAMRHTGADRFIFSSTAATYGEPDEVPIREDSPVRPTNPYGESKAICERMLQWYESIHGIRFAALRYFNAAGASEEHGEDHEPETHLIPLALRAVSGEIVELQIFGRDYPTPDGTCVRDYIHVLDLADAHILALERLGDLGERFFNLGNGAGYSVLDVVQAVERVAGKPVPVKDAPRRPGDPARLVASADRARTVLGWNPQRAELDRIVGDAWAWKTRFPNGYAD